MSGAENEPGKGPKPSQATIPVSPALSEANPQSLDALFSSDPLKMTDTDLAVIVRELRKQRERWAKAEAEGKTRAPSSRATTKSTAAAPAGLSLADLGFKS